MIMDWERLKEIMDDAEFIDDEQFWIDLSNEITDTWED